MNKATKIKQRDITDCGAACLASIASHYQLQIPVSRIRQYAGTDKRGTNVLGLIEAAEKLGLQAKGAKGALESLSKIPLPAIAHVVLKNGLHHFVVIYKVTKKDIIFMDPADGQYHRKIMSEFKEIWSGVIVLVLPDDSFKKGNETTSNAKRFWHLIMPHTGIMIQALVGAVVYTILGLSTSIYMQKLIDFVLPDGNIRLLNLLSIGMIVILLFQIFIGTFKTILGLQTGQQIDARLILGYYKHLLKLPQRFFDTMRVGEITSRINDAVKIRMFINDVALNMIVNVLIVGFSIGLMFLYYWKLAVIMLCIIPIFLILYWISNIVNKKWLRTLMENSAELETQLVESIGTVGTIKRFGIEEFANNKTENKFYTLLNSIYKSGIKNLYIVTSADFATRLFTILILWAGAYFVIKRELTPGELLSFYALIGYFTGPASSLIGANKSIQDALIAADRLFEIIDLEVESDNANKIELTNELIGDIKFESVDFRYSNRSMVFRDLSFIIYKGHSTGVIGESGSGKSTLLSLLQNLYPLSNGTISIGGLDLQNISNKSLRKLVSVVPQNIDLFAGSIIDNIALGDYEPNMLLILDICKQLGIDDFVSKLPNSYNSVLSEQAVNLSGGERQRLAIARALYQQPEILILDEATSHLDQISELKVQSTLNTFKNSGKTLIIIAHRAKTISNCDQVITLNQGQLVEIGDRIELEKNPESYYYKFKQAV